MRKSLYEEDAPPISFFVTLIGFIGLLLVGAYELVKLIADQGWLAAFGWGAGAMFVGGLGWLMFVYTPKPEKAHGQWCQTRPGEASHDHVPGIEL